VVKKNERKVQILEFLKDNPSIPKEVNDHLGINHAPRLLGYYQEQGLLKREEETLPQGGIKYRYSYGKREEN